MKSGVKSVGLANFVNEKGNTDYDFSPPNKFVGAENNNLQCANGNYGTKCKVIQVSKNKKLEVFRQIEHTTTTLNDEHAEVNKGMNKKGTTVIEKLEEKSGKRQRRAENKQDGNVQSRHHSKGSKSAKFLNDAQKIIMKSSENRFKTPKGCLSGSMRLENNFFPNWEQIHFFLQKKIKLFLSRNVTQ